jgi:ATP-dependent helicase HrpA
MTARVPFEGDVRPAPAGRLPFSRLIPFDAELPIAARREEIAQAIREHPVVIVCGETGSGKSTQLPKICLQLGRGVVGRIGHTQPRRIAARSVAARVAEELGTPLGREVGFKVRFAEALSDQSYIKLMTDGILLAETQGDPRLEQYDTIILDEAHERSLNIDFLMGYLKRLMPVRPDLRLIITSATIDAARFAEHFAVLGTASPVVEVSGRTYPVEVRWRPREADEEGREPDLQEAVLASVEELARIGGGDMLIFMPTERDIHETAKTLRGLPLPGDRSGRELEILPLYARLSVAQQQQVFQPRSKRRIVIATNVAESSLTVPRIRFVIDAGTARISRYSPRSKTQRLPIEAISRASADQRRGRCGRIGPGVCIRLFSEADYLARDAYTMPEIQRTNLAAVILRMKVLGLGEIEQFPFLDPPKPDAVRDGRRTLVELGAIDEHEQLTAIGRALGRLPVDPRIGRMILAARAEGCLAEMLIIAAALEVQDPRERPLEKQEAADACHAQWADEQSDFLACLKLWDFYHHLKGTLSRSALRKACRQNFLSENRIREWLDVHRELMELVSEARLDEARRRQGHGPTGKTKGDQAAAERRYAAIHRAILTGLLSSLAVRGDGQDYNVAGGGKAGLWPGSGVFRGRPKWIVAAEVVETTRRYLRTCGRIDSRWIEPIAAHLIRRSYSDLHWDAAWGSAVALERLVLFGLTVVAGRRVRYGPIDPLASREVFIEHALVQGDLEPKPAFLVHNEKLLVETERLQAKLRRRDLLVGPGQRYAFYDERLGPDVYDAAQLTRWLREDRQRDAGLRMTQADLLHESAGARAEAFPDRLRVGPTEFPLEYAFEPGAEHDGVTLTVPLEALGQLDPEPLEWLVPGLLEEKVLAMIRALPKPLRTRFVPAPEVAREVTGRLRHGDGNLRAAVAAALAQIGGLAVSPADFENDRLPAEMRLNVRVTDAEGQALAAGRDVAALRHELAAEAADVLAAVSDPQWNRDGLVTWDFEELPGEVALTRAGATVKVYPALVDGATSVSLRLVESAQRAARETRLGLRRLFQLAARRDLATQADWLPGLEKIPPGEKNSLGFDLRQEFADLLADRAFLANSPLLRTKAEFEAALRTGRQRIGFATQEVAEVMQPWLAAYRAARSALAAAAGVEPAKGRTWGALAAPAAAAIPWQYALDDVEDQLGRLAGPTRLCETPWNWLPHVPRFFRAICTRLDALRGGGLARDRKNFDEFLPRWQAYLQRAEQHAAQDVCDAELEQYRWMLEEYRVSLFAQKLGTSLPISPKRLDQQWAKVRG